MRRRQSLKINHPSQNLDSFLDILTNTVGVLMFISLFVTLIAVEADSVVRTPLASATKKTPRFFEIRDNEITYINDEKVGQEIEQLVGNMPACNPPEIDDFDPTNISQSYISSLSNYRDCLRSRGQRLVNFQTQTEYYNVRMVNASTFSLLYEPLEGKSGEDKEELGESNSQFNAVLANLDPQKDYLAFIVRPDSFSAFRAAREQAWAKGFNVGWEPHKEDAPIIFGSGGRSIGVQ